MTGLNIPYQFVAGTKAKANEVNANFNAVVAAIDEIYAQILENSNNTNSNLDTLNNNINTVDTKLTNFLDNFSNNVHFSVNKGKLDAQTGEPAILSANQTLITFDVSASNPIYCTNYKGQTYKIEDIEDLYLPSLADGVYTIYVNSDGQIHYYPLEYTCVAQLPDLPASDQVCVVTSEEPIKAYKYSGTQWEEFLDVPVGSFTISSSAISEITTFPYNQNGYNVNRNSFEESFTTNGWTKLPNGLIIQWGSYAFYPNDILSFPISFPNQCFGVFTGDNYNNIVSAAHVNVAIYSNSQFQIAEGICTDGPLAGKAYILAIGY